MNRLFLLALLSSLVLVSCDSVTTPSANVSDESSVLTDEMLGKKGGEENFDHIITLVDGVNKRLAAKGSEMRLDYPWLFRVGPGTDPFGRLRTGSRWMWTNPSYLLDESDYTTDVPFADVDAALVSAFDSWNDIPQTTLDAGREADGGDNYDVLDLPWLDGDGNCYDIVDTLSVSLDFYDPGTGAFSITPEADIVFGGWLDPSYFANCLGSDNIIGVTWSFSTGADFNGDQYNDRVYVEQYYNERFAWTTTDAAYLDFGAPFDIETIVVHENGHSHGLGHFGGPINRQPFKLKPNGRVFNPEAVMNPFYLGGEDRTPHATDEAGLKTLYGRKGN